MLLGQSQCSFQSIPVELLLFIGFYHSQSAVRHVVQGTSLTRRVVIIYIVVQNIVILKISGPVSNLPKRGSLHMCVFSMTSNLDVQNVLLEPGNYYELRILLVHFSESGARNNYVTLTRLDINKNQDFNMM